MSNEVIIILVVVGFIAGLLLGAWLCGDFDKTYAADDIHGMRADYKRKLGKRRKQWSWMRTYGAY